VSWLQSFVLSKASNAQGVDKKIREDAQSLAIELRPLPRACALGACYVTLIAVQIGLSIWRGQFTWAIAWALAGTATGYLLWRDLMLVGPQAPRQIHFLADGSIVIDRVDVSEQVRLSASSLFLGTAVLLVLQGRTRYRLFLGAGNVDPVTLAALRRRLR
jgi:uncharacterized protein YfiM (DUF2279 family)